MEIKKVSLSDLFAWLLASFRLIGNNPGKYALASLLSLSVMLVLLVGITLLMSSLFGGGIAATPPQQPPSLDGILPLYAGLFLVAILMAPPFMAGWLLFCQKLATGGDAQVKDLFASYGNKPRWRKLVVYSLVSITLYLLIHALYLGLCLAWGVSSADFQRVLEAQMQNDPNALAGLPAAFWLAYIGLLFLGFFLQTLFMLGFTQAALTDSTAGDALKAGIAGTLKNLPSLIAFLLIALVLGLMAVMALIVVLVLIAGLLAFLNQSLAMLFGAVFYLAFILYLYPLMFTFQYYCWQGILGTAQEPPKSDAIEVMI